MGKEQLSESTRGVIISCSVTMLSALLSEFLPNRGLQLIFVAILIVGIALYLMGQEKNNRKYLYVSCGLGGVLLVMLLVFSISPNLPQVVADWFARESSDSTENETPAAARDDLLKSQADLTAALSKLQSKMDRTVSGVAEMVGALDSDGLLSGRSNSDEVRSVLDKLMESEELLNSTSSRDDVMLCYKKLLYEMVCRYGSILQAFEEYGIDCTALGIDQYDLIRWDLQKMYNIYSIKKDLDAALAENPYYPSKTFRFNDYRVKMNEYSDVFDYGVDNFTLEKRDAKYWEKYLNDKIMKYYEKFRLNFSLD